MKKKSGAAWASSGVSVLLACIGLAGVPVGASADETLLCDKYINAVPYTITKPGHYCLKSNLSTAMISGNAITIESDSVWLDLNNFILDGSAAGPATAANGIYSENYSDITVRNGVVRGFMFGVDLETSARGRNYNVENIRAEGNTIAAIFLPSNQGPGGRHTIRNNVVIDTGGSTVFGGGTAFGITLGGDGNVSGNDVINVFGVLGQGLAFDLRDGTAIISDNKVNGADVGFRCASAGKFLRDNVAVVRTIPYDPLCTKIGITNFP